MKIVFFDMKNSGHHWFYNSELMLNLRRKNQIVYITEYISQSKLQLLKENDIEVILINKLKNKKENSFLFQQFKLLQKYYWTIKVAKQLKADVFVNLYFDSFILQYFLLNSSLATINVLHWFPNNKLKKILLFLMRTRTKDCFIVHTDNVKMKLYKINKKIFVNKIDYPVKTMRETDLNRNELLQRLNLIEEIKHQKVLLYFGGTRHDKGLDILLESLRFVKSNITLIVVGKEESFKKQFIQEELSKLNNNIRCILRLGYIQEVDVLRYFLISDVIILPYRAYFNGESGVLTDALNMGKPVIVPDIIHFPDILNKYKNGTIFKVEQPLEIARAIDITFNNLEYYKGNAKEAKYKLIQDRDTESFSIKFSETINRIKKS